MAVFTIISSLPNASLNAAIEAHYLGRYRHWSDRVSFVIGGGTAKEVADRLGVVMYDAAGAPAPGFHNTIVTQQFPSYWGWSDAEFWSWLASGFEERI